MSRTVRRWVGSFACVLALAEVPLGVVVIGTPAISRADDCAAGQVSVNNESGWECQDGACPPASFEESGVCIPYAAPPPPPPPVIVPVPVPRPNVNACVNLGGRRRVSVSGCI